MAAPAVCLIMSVRGDSFLHYARLRGYQFPALYSRFKASLGREDGEAVVRTRLTSLLAHCRTSVPYYAQWLKDLPNVDSARFDPFAVLARLPVLTKASIRENLDLLVSTDLAQRRWFFNTSGGSTGEPVRFIQDRETYDVSTAIRLLADHLWGREPGEPELRLWGSERDVLAGTERPLRRFFNAWTNTQYLNSFRMTPERMRDAVTRMNQAPPKLIVAYAQAAFELAGFIERGRLPLRPQQALATSAGTLYPFMRERIARVFGCPVYNLYGSREVSDVALELPGITGLWVPPWSVFVEVLDDMDQPAPLGSAGAIAVTCLKNRAMPLLRYRIGDVGALWPGAGPFANPAGQILQSVQGRSVDAFRTRQGTVVDGEYFTHLMYFRPWVSRFQVVQEELDRVVFRVVPNRAAAPAQEMEEIRAKTRLVLGASCVVSFEFPSELPDPEGGKYRYTISRIAA
jgi:phenylacetate-CoA ligase